MIKIMNTGFISQDAVDLLVRHGAVIDYNGKAREHEAGVFHKLPSNSKMSDFYGGEAGLGDTRIYRDILFAGHVVQMGVSDGRGGQWCDRLRIKRA